MDDLSALREFGSQLAPDDLEPPADLRSRVLLKAAERRRRPLILTAVAAATCAVIAGTALFAGHPLEGEPSKLQVTDAPADSCHPSVRPTYGPQDMADLLYLPADSLVVPGNKSPEFDRFEARDCTPPTEGATWYSLGGDGWVSRVFRLSGPDEANPGLLDDGPMNRSDVDLGGPEGTLYYGEQGVGSLYWTMPDGTRWHVSSAGLTPEQVVAAVRSIAGAEASVRLDETPAGLTEKVEAQQVPDSLPEGMAADFTFRLRGESKTTVKLQLRTERFPPEGPGPGMRPVDINGTTGWITEADSGGQVWMRWSPAAGIDALMSVKGTPAQAAELARSTVKADLDDPRLQK